MPEYRQIILTEKAQAYPLTQQMVDKLKPSKLEIVPALDLKTIPYSAEQLILDVKKTHFFHKCPGTRHYLCCGYFILESSFNCPFKCQYCFLRFYLNNPHTIIYVNTNDLFAELDHIHSCLGPHHYIRVGTGEFTDSLALDAYTQFSTQVVQHLSDLPYIIFELKTKSDQVDLLYNNPSVPPNLVIGWSLNPEVIIRHQEPGTANLQQRLTAARKLMQRGYKLALHFDPIFYYSGWETDYQQVITTIFQSLNPGQIAWISLGIFRFQPELRQKIFQHTPENSIIYNEFIRGIDGKERLHISIRYSIYQKMIQWLHRIDPKLFIYLCMESHYLWRELFNPAPQTMPELESQFIRRYLSIRS